MLIKVTRNPIIISQSIHAIINILKYSKLLERDHYRFIRMPDFMAGKRKVTCFDVNLHKMQYSRIDPDGIRS